MVNNIFANVDDQGYNTSFIQAIIDHSKTRDEINKENRFIVYTKGAKGLQNC